MPKRSSTLLGPILEGNISGNSLLPHTIESGDAYYIGDIYDQSPSPCSQEWELMDGVKRPYLDHVKNVSSAWPHLRYLADWMEVTTSPVKWKHIKENASVIRAERASRTKVAAVDLNANTGVTIRTFTSTSDLASAMEERSAAPPASAAATHRLYIVEDLSRDVIELLGRELDIDPLLFREQISDYTWFNPRDRWVELPELQAEVKDRSFFYLRFLRPRYFRSKKSFIGAIQEAGMFNVLRRLDKDRDEKSSWNRSGANVALIRSRTSFWWTPAIPGERGTIGILLLDPTVRQGFPLWNDNRSFHPTPSLSSPGPFKPPPKTSLFDAVLYWTQHMPRDQIAQIAQDPRAMLIPMAKIVCVEWLNVCEYVTARLKQVEWELEFPGYRLSARKANASQSILEQLYPLRRSVPLYRKMVREAMARLFPEGTAASPELQSLQPDFAAVEEELNDLQERIQHLVDYSTSMLSIDDSRREAALNRSLGRLSYLAAFFVPLSFISGLYSMAPELGDLSTTFWIYFATAVPVTVLAMVFVVDFTYFVDLWNNMREKITGPKEED